MATLIGYPHHSEKYPVQIQADNDNGEDSRVPCMCHVFDRQGLITMFAALTKQYRHVVAWDADGVKLQSYDNR